MIFAGLPDPFVEVTLGGHKRRTKSRTKTLNPNWDDEVQHIPIVNWALPNLLTLQVISKRSMKIQGQRQLGYVSLPHANVLGIVCLYSISHSLLSDEDAQPSISKRGLSSHQWPVASFENPHMLVGPFLQHGPILVIHIWCLL